MPSEEERIPHKTKPNQTKQKQKQQKKIGQFWGRKLGNGFLIYSIYSSINFYNALCCGEEKKIPAGN